MSTPGHAAAVISGDTIVAQSTATGRSAVALVRLSGPRAHAIARRHLRDFPAMPRVAELSAFLDTNGELIDQPIVTRYDAPHSYTGEDLVEISTHGGFVTPVRVIEQLILAGARLAEPGEFTRRAFLNGKMDLLQVEAVGDLIDSTSRAMARAAVQQLDRGLSRRIEELRDAILHVEALLAYDIDFPDEDEGPISRDRIVLATSDVRARLTDLLATAPTGELIREGALVVIAGPPNAGKSSLFNALIGRSRAIVTDIPGTTRDALEAVIEGPRWPLRLVDTAGLHQTSDVVERLGVEVSESHVRLAEVVLACGDSAHALAFTVSRVAELTSGTVIPVRTKADLGRDEGESGDAVAVSAETGDGLRVLLARVDEDLTRRSDAPEADTPVLTRARHRLALERALAEMNEFADTLQHNELPATVIATHLRAATGALEELIGVVDVEDVLGRVFAEFCVGK